MCKFSEYSKQIETLEQNKYQIHVVTQVQKVKNKYQGVGMFEIVTWKEQQSLVKLVRACKQRYDRLHGKSKSALEEKKKEKDEENKREEILKEEDSSLESSSSSSGKVKELNASNELAIETDTD